MLCYGIVREGVIYFDRTGGSPVYAFANDHNKSTYTCERRGTYVMVR